MSENIKPTNPLVAKRLNIFFVLLMAVVCGYFWFWGFGYVNNPKYNLLYTVSVVLGLFMAFNIGGNDVANSFGTSVGAGTLTITQALCVASIFEVSGAVLAGGQVTDTIRSGIVDLSAMKVEPLQFVYIMISALFAAAFWLLFATKKGWPVSTTHSIVGGIVGASITLGFMLHMGDAGGGSPWSMVKWGKIGEIAISWVLSPVLGGAVAYLLYYQIKKHIINYNDLAASKLRQINKAKKELRKREKTNFEALSEVQKLAYTGQMQRDAVVVADGDYTIEDLESNYYKEMYRIEKEKTAIKAFEALQVWVPMIAALGAMIISSMLLFKGLKNIDVGLTTLNNWLIMGMIGAGVWMATFIYAKTLRSQNLDRATFLLFSWMQVFTASGFAFSHGSNDIANAIGPFAAILDVLRTGDVGAKASIPNLAMVAFGVALIVGLWFIGKEVIKTIGTNLTEMHPASGFSAELSAAGVVMMASMLGLPVSSTHILVGAVLGIGLVNKSANWKLMKPIATAWVVTLPAAGILAAVCLFGLEKLF